MRKAISFFAAKIAATCYLLTLNYGKDIKA